MAVEMMTPRGYQVELDYTAKKTAEAIQWGSPTDGWAGDPQMFVCWNAVKTRWEIWRRDNYGRDSIVMAIKPGQFDSRVLKALAAGDTHTHNVLAELEKHEAEMERQQQRELQDLEDELADRYEFIARKASGSDDYTRQEARWYLEDMGR